MATTRRRMPRRGGGTVRRRGGDKDLDALNQLDNTRKIRSRFIGQHKQSARAYKAMPGPTNEFLRQLLGDWLNNKVAHISSFVNDNKTYLLVLEKQSDANTDYNYTVHFKLIPTKMIDRMNYYWKSPKRRQSIIFKLVSGFIIGTSILATSTIAWQAALCVGLGYFIINRQQIQLQIESQFHHRPSLRKRASSKLRQMTKQDNELKLSLHAMRVKQLKEDYRYFTSKESDVRVSGEDVPEELDASATTPLMDSKTRLSEHNEPKFNYFRTALTTFTSWNGFVKNAKIQITAAKNIEITVKGDKEARTLGRWSGWHIPNKSKPDTSMYNPFHIKSIDKRIEILTESQKALLYNGLNKRGRSAHSESIDRRSRGSQRSRSKSKSKRTASDPIRRVSSKSKRSRSESKQDVTSTASPTPPYQQM